jgi:hypothetical protein
LKIIVKKNRKTKRKEETGCLFVLKTKGWQWALSGPPQKKGPNFRAKLENSSLFKAPPPYEIEENGR